jgi:hypothetical protein
MNKIEKLQENLQLAVKEIIQEFEKKHDLMFLYWNDDNTFEIAFFDDGFNFTFNDILFDVFTNQDPKLILTYFQRNLESKINQMSYELFVELKAMQ